MPLNIAFSVTPLRLASAARRRFASFSFSSGATFFHLANAVLYA